MNVPKFEWTAHKQTQILFLFFFPRKGLTKTFFSNETLNIKIAYLKKFFLWLSLARTTGVTSMCSRQSAGNAAAISVLSLLWRGRTASIDQPQRPRCGPARLARAFSLKQGGGSSHCLPRGTPNAPRSPPSAPRWAGAASSQTELPSPPTADEPERGSQGREVPASVGVGVRVGPPPDPTRPHQSPHPRCTVTDRNPTRAHPAHPRPARPGTPSRPQGSPRLRARPPPRPPARPARRGPTAAGPAGRPRPGSAWRSTPAPCPTHYAARPAPPVHGRPRPALGSGAPGGARPALGGRRQTDLHGGPRGLRHRLLAAPQPGPAPLASGPRPALRRDLTSDGGGGGSAGQSAWPPRRLRVPSVQRGTAVEQREQARQSLSGGSSWTRPLSKTMKSRQADGHRKISHRLWGGVSACQKSSTLCNFSQE